MLGCVTKFISFIYVVYVLFYCKILQSKVSFFCRFVVGCSVVIALGITVCGFAKAGHFSTTVHLKNHTSIIRKNCQPKHCAPAFAKPMLQAALLLSLLYSPNLYYRVCVVEQAYSFASYGLRWLVGLANVYECKVGSLCFKLRRIVRCRIVCI